MTDTPTADAIQAVIRTVASGDAPAGPFGNDFPEHAPDAKPAAPGPIDAAFRGAAAGLDSIEHRLGDLNGVLERLAYNLSPVLTGGTYDDPMTNVQASIGSPEEDRRSTLARRITGLEARARQLADVITYLTDKLNALDTALELEGFDR